MMLCRLWCVFHFRFENLYTKIFATTPHIISQHSPRLGAIFIFLIRKCFETRRIKEFWVFWNFDLNWFTWLWGDDVVQIMVCVPFSIWKFVHQNICYYSPHNLTTLPRLGAIFIFLILKCFQARTIKEFWAFLTFDLISFTWMWGDDVVQIMVCVPFSIWKSIHQNICYHSHIISQHSPPLGVVFIFLIWKLFQARRIKEFWAFWTFDLISFTWIWGNDVVQIMVCVPFSIWKFVHQNICYHSPHNFIALPTSRRNIYFFNFKMLPSKEDKLELWFKLIYMTVRWWCCADYGVCSIFDLKICTLKYLLPLPI